jgi:hypothetical protein
MTAAELQRLRLFHALAGEARAAVSALDTLSTSYRVVDGFLETAGATEAYRLIAVPLRRLLLPSDPANITAICRILASDEDARAHGGEQAAGECCAVLGEMDEQFVLGGERTSRMAIFRAWLDATVFYDDDDRRKPYEEMLNSFGRSIQGTAEELARAMAQQVTALDDTIVAAGILPPLPPPAPPPEPPRRGGVAGKMSGLLRKLTGAKPPPRRRVR